MKGGILGTIMLHNNPPKPQGLKIATVLNSGRAQQKWIISATNILKDTKSVRDLMAPG